MTSNEILASIDAEIDKLQKVKALLVSSAPPERRPYVRKKPLRRRRSMSPEARRRISEATKARWAKLKAGKTAKK